MSDLFNKKLVSPLVVFWELTQKCNLRCSHCYTSSRKGGFQLNDQQIVSILDVICCQDIFSLGLGGGEPLLLPMLPDIVRKASKNNIDVSISTNGTLLTMEKAQMLKDSGLKLIQISIDGGELIHEKIRGKGTYLLAKKAIINSRKVGLTTRVAITVNSLNFNEIDNVFNLFLDLGVDWFIAFRYMESGRSGNTISKKPL